MFNVLILVAIANAQAHDVCYANNKVDVYEPPFYPKDCKELYDRGENESGIYTVFKMSAGSPVPIHVYCDMGTDGGGWLVFHRRQDGSVNFYRNWVEFEDGFGYINGEFWLGNDLIHVLSESKPQEMRVDLRDFEDVSAHAKYGHFSVGPASSLWRLNISDYSGTAGDSLTRNNGHGFTTWDRDNDISPNNCAELYKGGWWYDRCHLANLNGPYRQSGPQTSYADHVVWRTFREYYYSLKFTEMKMRPRNA